MVLNIGKLKSGDFEYVEADIKAVCDLAGEIKVPVKVIFENFYLTDEEKVKACEICTRAGAGWVKTSTGFAGGGATIEDLQLMRANTPRKHSGESRRRRKDSGCRSDGQENRLHSFRRDSPRL